MKVAVPSSDKVALPKGENVPVPLIVSPTVRLDASGAWSIDTFPLIAIVNGIGAALATPTELIKRRANPTAVATGTPLSRVFRRSSVTVIWSSELCFTTRI